jgi:hypothetical protein
MGVAQLEAVNYSRLRQREGQELSKLIRACQNDGFFYLDLTNVDDEQMLRDWGNMLPPHTELV